MQGLVGCGRTLLFTSEGGSHRGFWSEGEYDLTYACRWPLYLLQGGTHCGWREWDPGDQGRGDCTKMSIQRAKSA